MVFESEQDRFFQFATFTVVGLTVLVCLCYALIFFNPRLNPIAALRPLTPTPRQEIVTLPPTWTPTFTLTPTSTPTPTLTFTPSHTPTETPTSTPTPTETPTFLPTPTKIPAPITRRPPTRQPTPTASFEFRLGRPVETAPNCGTWYVAGTVYSDQAGTARLNGLLVRIWAFGQVQGTDVTGSHANRPGYWEWIFAHGSNVQGEVAIVHPDGSLRSPKVAFALTADCNAPEAIQQVIIDFVGGQ